MDTPQRMRAVAQDEYGGLEKLSVREIDIPPMDAREVLIKVSHAGVAGWDIFHREGGFDELVKQMHGEPQRFPLIIGSDGAGEIVAVGDEVTSVTVGDQVYAGVFLNPKGGFYAEYAVVPANGVAPVPKGMSLAEAAVLAGDGGTALRGLADVLQVKQGESLLILGAGGGLGHFAVQLAKRMGAKVLAVASGSDGKQLAERLGADVAIDGRKDDIAAAAKAFAPDGLDVALLTAGGDVAEQVLSVVRQGGRAAYPHGVMPEPQAPAHVTMEVYNGDVDTDLLMRLNDLVEGETFSVEIAETFDMGQAVDAHRMLEEHYLGKIAMSVTHGA